MQDHHADLIGRSRKRAKTRENVTTDEAGALLRDADDKQTAVRASSERDEVMAWGDTYGCDYCGEIWVEPSKNSVKKSFGGMHAFMASHGFRRTPDGYEQANLMIDDFIDQARGKFQREHLYCSFSSSESDEERCEVCGEYWVEPSKNSIKKKLGGMHKFMASHGLRRTPGGYKEASLMIDDLIAQEREDFIREHQYCEGASSPSSSSSEYYYPHGGTRQHEVCALLRQARDLLGGLPRDNSRLRS